MYGICKICHCTETNPCIDPDQGPCWWVNDSHDLCSACEAALKINRNYKAMLKEKKRVINYNKRKIKELNTELKAGAITKCRYEHLCLPHLKAIFNERQLTMF